VALLSAFFGGLAVLLASIGLYGLMSDAVTRRRSEIGVRMALGADPGNVVALILGDALLLVLIGVAVGVPASLLASRLVTGMLFGLSPTDPTTICFAASILIAVALLAGYLPARHASRIDPMTALREE
jgi:ABC-type antimicrobial peptide transport system permease subunit